MSETFELPPLERTVIPDDDPPKRTSSRTQTSAPRVSNKKLAEELLVPWAFMAQGFAMVAPTVSAVMLHTGEEVTQALVSIAEQHPKMLNALKKATQIGPGFVLAQAAVGIAVAGMLDFGRIPPTHPLAKITQVDDVYYKVHPDEKPESTQFDMNGFAPPNPESGQMFVPFTPEAFS